MELLNLDTRALARHIEHHATIGSTNDRAKQLAADGAPHGTVVVADAQTAGRGQRGHKWHSPAGSGLYVSFIVRPQLPARRAPALTLLAAVALREALDQSCGAATGIKWPNDLLAVDSRKKLAGILVELASEGDRIAHAVIGAGINLHDVPRPTAIADYATSVESLTGQRPETAPLLGSFANALESRLLTFETEGPAGILKAWSASAIGLDEVVEVTSGDSRITGRLTGVAIDGALELMTAEGPCTLHTGALHLPGAPHPMRSDEQTQG